MIFASKTSRDIFKPAPPTGDYWFDQRYAAAMYAQEVAFTQHNEPNPILVAYRAALADPSGYVRSGNIERLDDWIPDATPAHQVHALKVITRLANLTEGETK